LISSEEVAVLSFFIRTALNKTANKLVAKIMTPSGMAEYSPAKPTSGEVTRDKLIKLKFMH
jgi:hypothetical protein